MRMTITVRVAAAALLAGLLAACAGIPLTSLPQLMRLQGKVLDTPPDEVMLANQVDARLVPRAGAVPRLKIAMTPKEPGSFVPVDENLPMAMSVASTATLGLKAPPAGRRWLIYSLPPESQAALRRIQAQFRQVKSENRGGSLAIGISQEGMAANDPAMAETRWETWVQVSRIDGFFELWSGTVAELVSMGKH
jgi:hypothetical protein